MPLPDTARRVDAAIAPPSAAQLGAALSQAAKLQEELGGAEAELNELHEAYTMARDTRSNPPRERAAP